MAKAPVPAGQVSEWEETDSVPSYTEEEYKATVEGLIRERYTVSDEFALINNVMTAPTEATQEEYARYQQYREECKHRAKEALTTSEETDKQTTI